MINAGRLLVVLTTFFLLTGSHAQHPLRKKYSVFRNDPLHSGNYHRKNYNHLDSIKWKLQTGGKIFSSPALAGGMIYIGSSDDYLYAADRKTGKVKWKFKTAGDVHSTPAIFKNRVYFGSADGNFYALDARTGKEYWRFKTHGETSFGSPGLWGMKPDTMYMNDLFDFYLSSPVIGINGENNAVYVGSGSGYVYALDLDTGKPKWEYKTGGVVHSSPALYNGTIYIGSWDSNLYAIDALSGKVKWNFTTGPDARNLMNGIQSSPAIADGLVYFGARDAHFYALNAETGQLVWKYCNDNAWILSSASVYNGVVYIGTSDNFLLLALDSRTGKKIYGFNTKAYVYSSPAIAGNTAYFGTFHGKVVALDLSSAGQHWSEYQVEAGRKNGPDILNEKGYTDWGKIMAGRNNYLYETQCYAMDRLYTMGPILSSPVADRKTLYFGSADGCLYALKLTRAASPPTSMTGQ